MLVFKSNKTFILKYSPEYHLLIKLTVMKNQRFFSKVLLKKIIGAIALTFVSIYLSTILLIQESEIERGISIFTVSIILIYFFVFLTLVERNQLITKLRIIACSILNSFFMFLFPIFILQLSESHFKVTNFLIASTIFGFLGLSLAFIFLVNALQLTGWLRKSLEIC